MEHRETDCETSRKVRRVRRESRRHISKCQQAHTVLRPQIRNLLRKWYQNQGSTVFILTSQKIEIAKYACEPKRQGLLAEDALAKQYLEQKKLVT